MHSACFYEIFSSIQKNEDEPMMNILSSYEQEKGWRIIIFLREKHRSAHFYEAGENNILLSPVPRLIWEGVYALPTREADFAKITKDQIAEILNEVSLRKETFRAIKIGFKREFKGKI